MRRLFITLLLSMLLAVPAAATDLLPGQSLVSVGSGYVVRAADLAVVSLAIETEAKEAGTAYRDNLTIVGVIADTLKKAELPGLKITVRQPSIWDKPSLMNRETTYTASSGLDVHVSDITLVGQIADIGLAHGAKVQNVRFDVSDLESTKQEAVEKAVQDAITKAKVMSAAAGLRVAMVRELRDTNDIQVYNPSVPQGNGATLEGKLPPLVGPVYRGQVMVVATVTVTFDVALDKSKDVLK